MGRKKIDKTSIEYLCKNLFYKDDITGFQITAGKTPRAVRDKEDFWISVSLNKSKPGSVVIDLAETELTERISKELLPTIYNEENCQYYINSKQLKSLQKQFFDIGYPIESCKTVGEWHWMRVHCTYDMIPFHVNTLKQKIKL